MTIQEAAKVVRMIHTAYTADRKATPEELADRIDLWAVFFADYDAELVTRIVKAWIRTNKYMPQIEEIKNACDVRRRMSQTLKEADFVPEDLRPIPPEEEKRLESLWREIVTTESIIEESEQ